jgi:3-oxoacyl-[acyl-carrier-protein] synthase III
MKLDSIAFALGEKKVKVSDLFYDARLIAKTGIEHVYETCDNTSLLAKRAVVGLGNFDTSDISACIMVTQSPDDFLPANAIPISSDIGLDQSVLAFDINQGCSGFVQALALLDVLLNKHKKILLITADRYRSKLSVDDRSTNAVFSDGATASIWSNEGDRELIFEQHLTDGSKRDWLYHSAASDHACNLHMSGAEVWTFTRTKVIPMLQDALRIMVEQGYEIGSVYLHQASAVVVDGIKAAVADVDNVKIPTNYFNYGNTVSSTIPILLSENGMTQQSGAVDIFCGFGVGLSCSIVGLVKT